MLCDDCKYKEACRFYIASFENVNHPLNDPYYRDSFYCDEHCTVEKPITNADRIRAMTDEELARELIVYRDGWGDYDTPCGVYDEWDEAYHKTLDWFKQPAEEET